MKDQEIRKSPVFCDLCEKDVAEYHAFKGDDESDLMDNETVSISLCENCFSKTGFDSTEELEKFAIRTEQSETFFETFEEFMETRSEEVPEVYVVEKRIREILESQRCENGK